MKNETHLSHETFNSLPIETQRMFHNLSNAIREIIIVPNSWLPEEMHDNTRGGRTLARLHKMCDVKEYEYQKIKAIKARNIERLAAQVKGRDIDRELDYSNNETDELAQYLAEVALVGGMVSGGLIDADDLKNEL